MQFFLDNLHLEICAIYRNKDQNNGRYTRIF